VLNDQILILLVGLALSSERPRPSKRPRAASPPASHHGLCPRGPAQGPQCERWQCDSSGRCLSRVVLFGTASSASSFFLFLLFFLCFLCFLFLLAVRARARARAREREGEAGGVGGGVCSVVGAVAVVGQHGLTAAVYRSRVVRASQRCLPDGLLSTSSAGYTICFFSSTRLLKTHSISHFCCGCGSFIHSLFNDLLTH